jgi:energy-coupling factor transporter ATP-binding protein EcfA2
VDDVSYDELVTRLTAADGPDDAVADLVLAAADGPASLEAHLDGGEPAERRIPVETITPHPPRAYLTEIAITGFRGVADRARLPFEPGPGLTLVVGRNGSGKSSFAEGLELLLTGRNSRWDNKPKAWRDGWRNLHASDATRLTATFRIEGRAETVRLERRWGPGVALDESDRVAVSGGVDSWSGLGWDESLERYRPLLSYTELGTMFSERAADLYTALSAVLGLEPFDATQAVLRDARLARGRSAKEERQLRTRLRETLAGVEDDRAARVLAELGRRTPDLDVVSQAIAREETDTEVAGLQALARVAVPSEQEIVRAVAGTERAREQVERLETTDIRRASELADLLAAALRFHDDHTAEDDACPVCGTPAALGGDWRSRTEAQLAGLEEAAVELSQARTAAKAAEQAFRALFALETPAVLRRAELNVEPASHAWDAWSADRTAVTAELLREALGVARDRAERELERRDATWRPLEIEIAGWLARAQEARRDKLLSDRLVAAEDWMKSCTAALRAERLAPIVAAAQANWADLRHESNVALGDVALAKSGLQKSVVFDVTVDGATSSAFGVMSQGELSALAISVFLPRASLPDTPFGFIVIDDPVQSMDPAKVDGLARVLARAAEVRQVIVFTHDDRLAQAVERLAIPARILEVKRRALSRVEVVAGSRPSERYLREAFALSKTSELPASVRGRVVPGFCRSAIEAACATRIRRRRLDAGESPASVEAVLTDLTSLNTWLAEAFEIPLAQGEAINAQLRRIGGEDAIRVVRLSKAGAHREIPEDEAMQLARATERLVERLEAA